MTTITIGGRAGATTAGIQDAKLLSGFPTTNFSADAASDQSPFLLRPDLTALPPGAVVSDAFWTLACTSGGGATTVHIVRCRRAWVEAEATWNVHSTGNNWTTAGGLDTTNDILGADSAVIAYTGGFATGDFVSSSNTGLIADLQAYADGSIADLSWRFDDGGTVAFGLPGNGTAANTPLLTIVFEVVGPTASAAWLRA
jgi:hypothetical protein